MSAEIDICHAVPVIYNRWSYMTGIWFSSCDWRQAMREGEGWFSRSMKQNGAFRRIVA
jgi:hypothetical protein